MKKLIIPMCQIGRFFFIALLFVSCQSTDVFFDMENQSIVSCNQRTLNRIIIECDITNVTENDCIIDLYSKNAPASIEIDSICKIYDYKKRQKIFYPNSCYKITFIGGGDDGYTELKIWLDSQGKVYKTNKPTCN